MYEYQVEKAVSWLEGSGWENIGTIKATDNLAALDEFRKWVTSSSEILRLRCGRKPMGYSRPVIVATFNQQQPWESMGG